MSSHSAPRRARVGTARERAADVLVRVETESAFAAPVLDAALDREPRLNHADRGLATEIVYGVLRSGPALDAMLQRFAPRAGSIQKLDAYARSVMRIAAYEILVLERVPPRASVHAAVETLKRDRSQGLGGFANAVLRKVTGERREPIAAEVRERLAVESVPAKVRGAIAEGVGSEGVDPVLRAMFARAGSVDVRVQAHRVDREAAHARIVQELPGASVSIGGVSPWALRIAGGGDVRETGAYREGLFAIQEEGAQCVALATGARPGMAVLDACAGRGGKTTALAMMMQSRGTLHAVEMYPDKVAQIEKELSRLGLAGEGLAFAAAPVDLTRGLGGIERWQPEGYDVVLVDAPCSGLGTLGRRPDIAARRAEAGITSEDAGGSEPSERVELPVLQRGILERVAPRVRVGGVLVYAVCTLTRAEGEGVVSGFRAAHPEFVPAEGESAPERLRGAVVTLRPDRDGTDGFVMFRLRRAGNP